jgi:polyferredoxin
MCGLCIDACDTVMKKVDRPARLIAYDTDINMVRRAEGQAPIYHIVRPRTLIYAGIIAVVGSIMLYSLLTRDYLDISVRHDRNPLFVSLSDGSIRNAYGVHLLNKRTDTAAIGLDVEGLPNAEVRVVGLEEAATAATPTKPVIEIGPDQGRELRVLVTVPANARLDRSTPLTFRVTDTATHETAVAADHFIAR